MSEPWWRSAAVYQVYPRSFMDASGDGDGDLLGVIERLPYLARLGIDAIWLSPFYPSPQLGGGYDVADPRGIDPRYGTLDDARALIESAHANGLRVIFDVVPNHFSPAHPWFALAAGPGPPRGSASTSARAADPTDQSRRTTGPASSVGPPGRA